MNKFIKKFINVMVSILFIGLTIYIDYFSDNTYNIYMVMALFSMLIGWTAANKNNKKSLIFYIGILYIIIPMIYWYITKQEKMSILFFIMILLYNVISFVFFKIIDGLQIKINRILLKRIINVITAFTISYLCLYLKFLNNDNFQLLYCISVTLSFTTMLLISDFMLTRIKPLSENNYIKELSTTESIMPTHGIIIKIANSFLFISYVYIIYVVILKLI
ncbi:MAG: hypothetical protein IJU54_01840 [Alphaproteobacteria bacterium]|nr:hypothetical protein [Alphaproteobacteria bacterium]